MTTTNPALRPRPPVRRRKRTEVILVGHRRLEGEEIAQVGERLDAVAQARGNDRVKDRAALPRLGMAEKQPVFHPQLGGARRVFDQVIVQPALPVLDVAHEHYPLPEQVTGSLAESGLDPVARAQDQRQSTLRKVVASLMGVKGLPTSPQNESTAKKIRRHGRFMGSAFAILQSFFAVQIHVLDLYVLGRVGSPTTTTA